MKAIVITALLSLFISISAATAGEDWSSLPLSNSDLKIADVVIAERDEYPTFTRDMIQITWRADDPIYLFVILPKNLPKPPVIPLPL